MNDSRKNTTINQIGRVAVITGICICLFSQILLSQSLSQSFEFRYVTKDQQANGITDFKGETAVFSTSERIAFLSHYADYASAYFDDPGLNKQAVSDKQLDSLMGQLKPQPLPKVRERIRLSEWQWTGYKAGQRKTRQKALLWWSELPHTRLENNSLVFLRKARIHRNFRPQSWRFSFRWKVQVPTDKSTAYLELHNNEGQTALTVGLNKDNQVFYTHHQDTSRVASYEKNRWYTLKLEVDLKHHRYNLYVNKEKAADFVFMQTPATKMISSFSLTAGQGTKIGSFLGTGYFLTGEVGGPYYPETFIDEDFTEKPCMEGWKESGYADSLWEITELPHVHGGERHAKEKLYLRKKTYVGAYERAFLNVEPALLIAQVLSR